MKRMLVSAWVDVPDETAEILVGRACTITHTVRHDSGVEFPVRAQGLWSLVPVDVSNELDEELAA